MRIFPGFCWNRTRFSQLQLLVYKNPILVMETKVIKVTQPKEFHLLKEAVNLLREGQVVAIPTETVYGLAANALDPVACEKIYTPTNRPAHNPLILHVSNYTMLKPI